MMHLIPEHLKVTYGLLIQLFCSHTWRIAATQQRMNSILCYKEVQQSPTARHRILSECCNELSQYLNLVYVVSNKQWI